MNVLRYMLRIAVTTAIIAPLLRLLTHDPNWLWNIPLGLLFGALGGLVLYWPSMQLVAWLERREDRQWQERRALLNRLSEDAEKELDR